MESVVQMALDIQECIQKFSFLPHSSLQLRIGIHAGQLVAGVIGDRKFAYDLWGDTVNTASRMESYGIPGKIHCTAIVYEMLQDKFQFEKRDPIDIKGKGKMQTYFIRTNSH
jgi:class 3 adenylate cyclase